MICNVFNYLFENSSFESYMIAKFFNLNNSKSKGGGMAKEMSSNLIPFKNEYKQNDNSIVKLNNEPINSFHGQASKNSGGTGSIFWGVMMTKVCCIKSCFPSNYHLIKESRKCITYMSSIDCFIKNFYEFNLIKEILLDQNQLMALKHIKKPNIYVEDEIYKKLKFNIRQTLSPEESKIVSDYVTSIQKNELNQKVDSVIISNLSLG